MEEFKQMAKKKEPTNGELMAKEIIAKYKPMRIVLNILVEPNIPTTNLDIL